MFNQVQGLALVVVLSILTLAVGAIVLSNFQDTQARCIDAGAFYNTTTGACSSGAERHSWLITNDGLASVDNVSNQYPVAGTLIGIGVLLAAIAAAFSFFRMRA